MSKLTDIVSILLVLLWALIPVSGFVAPSETAQTLFCPYCLRDNPSPILPCHRRCLRVLLADPPSGQKIKFSESIAVDSNPVDKTLAWIISDAGSIVLGLVGLLLVVIRRLATDDSSSEEDLVITTRSSLLAVVAVGAVLLNGLSQLDVQTALAETVELEGVTVELTRVSGSTELEVDWALAALLRATPASTAVVMELQESTWRPVAFSGTVPPTLPQQATDLQLTDTPILDRFRTEDSKESYLPTLQALPGKAELTGKLLPINTQAAVLIPLRKRHVLLLGSNQGKSFTPRDIAWCQSVVQRI